MKRCQNFKKSHRKWGGFQFSELWWEPSFDGTDTTGVYTHNALCKSREKSGIGVYLLILSRHSGTPSIHHYTLQTIEDH